MRQFIRHFLDKLSGPRHDEELVIDMNQTPFGVVVVDSQTGQFLRVNAVFAQFVGRTTQELLSSHWSHIAVDETAQAVSEGLVFLNHAASVMAVHEQRFLRPDGVMMYGEVTKLTNSQSSSSGTFTLLVRDIAACMRSMERLRINDQRYRLLADSARDVVWTMSPMGEITYISPAIEQLRGITPQEAMKMPIEETLTPASQAVSLGYFMDLGAAIQKGEPLPSFHGNLEYYRKDGSTFWTEVLSFPLMNKDGQLVEIVGVTRDISERRLYEENLLKARDAAEKANAAKSEFLAHISHEIRTPMTAIMSLTDLALTTDLNDVQREYLSKTKSSGNLLLGIINDILDLSQMEAGKFVLVNAPFDLLGVLRQVSHVVEDTCSLKGLRYQVEVAQDVPLALQGDAQRIAQALLNMVGNAVKFTEQGHIDVRVTRLGGDDSGAHLEFSVKDTGVGVDPAFQASAFEGFARGDNALTRSHSGTGLGLAITKRLANSMGGDVGVKSALGQGATFWFTVRVAVASSAMRNPQNPHLSDPEWKATLKGKKVLVVDDNPTLSKILIQLLTLVGIEVETAENGLEALRILEASSFQLILMDMQMPIMNGLEATKVIRQNVALQDLPIIALTAGGFEKDRDQYLQAGMNDYLSKPFHYEELLDVLYRNLPVPLNRVN